MDGAATNRSAIEKALSIPNALYPDSKYTVYNPDGKTVYTFISDIKVGGIGIIPFCGLFMTSI